MSKDLAETLQRVSEEVLCIIWHSEHFLNDGVKLLSSSMIENVRNQVELDMAIYNSVAFYKTARDMYLNMMDIAE